MKQRAHAWVALRALKLIDDWRKAPKLTEMLSYYLPDVWDGAWLPDIRIRDMRYGHIYKMDSDPSYMYPNLPNEKRYVKSQKDLKKLLVGKRLCLEYLTGLDELTKPYRSHPKEGGHLPNRVIALSHSIGDMLKMSDFPIEAYTKKRKKIGKKGKVLVTDSSGIPRDISSENIRDLSKSPNFSARQISLSFFLLSHYICDALMPLHCDLRDLTVWKRKKKKRRLPVNFHPWIERIWDENFPQKEQLILHKYSKKSLNDAVEISNDSIITIDNSNSKYELSNTVHKSLAGDEWHEMVYITRVSYGVSRKWISTDNDWYALKKQHFPNYSDFKTKLYDGDNLGDGAFVEGFKDVTNSIFHDAVESVARIWYKAWKRYIE